MTGHEGHHGGCYTATAVRFCKPDETPSAVALAAGAVAGVLTECKQRQHHPDSLINVVVGPAGLLTGLWEKLVQPGADGPRSLAAADQVDATFKAEPVRFAAVAFAHVVSDDQS